MTNSQTPTLQDAKKRLDNIINKARVDLYKPIQIAEVLYHSRNSAQSLDLSNLENFRINSRKWRDEVSKRLLGKVSTSSIKFQDDVWNDGEMNPHLLKLLDDENKKTKGVVERYIYLQFQNRQDTVAGMIALLDAAKPEEFKLSGLLQKFESIPGIKRSIDKAYEIVVHSLLETLVISLEATVTVEVPASKSELLEDFSDLAKILLGVSAGKLTYSTPAHVYRVGVTNAADRGLDMWANFGPAIQVKHINLNAMETEKIVSQIESDSVVIVCQVYQKPTIAAFLQQMSWASRVKGIITQEDLIEWYERCLRGKYKAILAESLLTRLENEFKREFRSATDVVDFLANRDYTKMMVPSLWEITL